MKKLSVIITAHAEGLLAHKTMRSIFENLEPIIAAHIPYEIIIHIDRGTPETIAYFERYQTQKCCKIYNNNFGDPGLSRNSAISKATGDIVSLLDADDLMSSNWLQTAYDIVAKSKDPVIVHPFACLTFGVGVHSVLNFYGPSLTKEEDALTLIGENRWGVVAMAPKSIFTKFPYIASQDGYGHEDYHFSTSTIAAGIKHLVAPETVLFYRRGNHSVLDSNNSAGAVQPYSPLFDEVHPERKPALDPAIQASRRPALYRGLQHLYHTSLRFLPGRETLKKIAYRFVSQNPHYTTEEQIVTREWRRMNHIDTLLCPTREHLDQLSRYSEFQNIDCGLKYYELMGDIKQKPDYIFIVPWITTGGADKVVINYAKAVQRLRPQSRVMVITTLQSDNRFKQLLPDNVDFIDFGNATVDLHPFLKDRLFSRIITQSQCAKVHIINSDYGYLWVKNHLDFAKTLDLRLSTFCREFVAGFGEECFFDYADQYLPLIAPAVKHIYTDNATHIKYLVNQCGIAPEDCAVHYQFIPEDTIRPVHADALAHRPTRILWASRLTPTKRPDLLCAIARQLSKEDFQIDVYGTAEPPYSAKTFAGIPTINFRGAYHGIESLDTSKYDAFLYTSDNDGVPNVILEMVARGLPVIASDSGGIGEIIKTGHTGTLVENSAPAFVSALQDLRANYAKYSTAAIAAQDLLRQQHSEAQFIANVKAMLK